MSLTLELPHVIAADKAPLIWDWLTTRGGIAIWKSQNLSNPGASWSAPYLGPEGKPKAAPNWQCLAPEPSRVITDADEILVSVDQEVRRFYVAVRPGASGLNLKLTDGATRKVNAAVEKAGQGAYHVFDYATQEAVIMAPVSQQTLKSWAHEKGLI